MSLAIFASLLSDSRLWDGATCRPGVFRGSSFGGLAGASGSREPWFRGKWSRSMQTVELLLASECPLAGGRGTGLFSMSNTVSGVNRTCSRPEEGLSGRVTTGGEEEAGVEEVHDDDVDEKVGLCRAGGEGKATLKGFSKACRGRRKS